MTIDRQGYNKLMQGVGHLTVIIKPSSNLDCIVFSPFLLDIGVYNAVEVRFITKYGKKTDCNDVLKLPDHFSMLHLPPDGFN